MACMEVLRLAKQLRDKVMSVALAQTEVVAVPLAVARTAFVEVATLMVAVAVAQVLLVVLELARLRSADLAVMACHIPLQEPPPSTPVVAAVAFKVVLAAPVDWVAAVLQMLELELPTLAVAELVMAETIVPAALAALEL